MTSAALARGDRASTARRATPRALSAGRRPPALLALALLVPTVVTAVAMVLAASLIGPFIMFALPFMLLFGLAIGPLVALVRGDLG